MEKEIFCPICGSSLGKCIDTTAEKICEVCGNSIYLAVAIPEGFKKPRAKKIVENNEINAQAPVSEVKEDNGLESALNAQVLDSEPTKNSNQVADKFNAQNGDNVKTNKSDKPESKSKKTKSTWTKPDKSLVLDDPDPIDFPANTKAGKIVFWIIFALTLLFVLPVVALFSPTLSAGLEYSVEEVFGIAVYGVIFLIALITWLTYWLMRKFKGVDPTKPVAIKVLQWFFLIVFLGSLCALIMFGGSAKLISILPEGLIDETSFVNDWAKYAPISNIAIYACPISLAILFLVCAVNKARFNCELAGKSFSIWSFIFGLFSFVIFIGIIVVILSGIVMLLNMLLPNLVASILGENAQNILEVIDKVLMYSSITTGACFILNIFISFKTVN